MRDQTAILSTWFESENGNLIMSIQRILGFCILILSSATGHTAEWQAVAAINTPRSHFAAGVVGDKIVIFGGQNAETKSVNSLEVLDTTHPSAWTMLPGPDIADIGRVKEFAGTGLNNEFFVCGSYDGIPRNNRYNFVAAYDLNSGIWTEKTSMPTNRFQAVAANYAEQIYVFGGEYAQSENSKSFYYKVVEAFKPGTDSWRSVTHLPQLRLLPGVAVLDQKAYIIGGGQVGAWKTFGNVYAYDFLQNNWIKSGLTKLPTPRVFSFGHAAPVLNGKIYLVGGATAGKRPKLKPSAKVEIYDPRSNTWQVGPAVPQPVLYNAAVAAGNDIFLIGGQTDSSESSAIANVWKLADAWKYNLAELETCDLNADGKFSNIDANLFTAACFNDSAYWQCDLNNDGKHDTQDTQLYKTQWQKAAKSCKDGILYQAFAKQVSNLQAEGQGKVTRILPNDNDGDRHQRFILRLNSGQTLLVAHNIDLAPRVDGLKSGDSVSFYGEYEYNEQGGVIHWTHHDPDNRHEHGWLKHSGKTYQ